MKQEPQARFTALANRPRALLIALVIAHGLLLPATVSAQCTNCTTTTVGGDVVHTFASGSGTFTPPANVTQIEYLVVAGGAGGGGIPAGGNFGGAGGGGAGGYQTGTGFAVTPLSVYNITVGAGGAGGVGNVSQGSNGENSTFDSITAIGGGGGASGGVNNDGEDGGSGGGGRIASGDGGNGIGGQGNDGGDGANGAGGGGGATQDGENGAGNAGGDGGNGQANGITGAAVTYADGGDGGDYGARSTGANAAANSGDGGDGASGGNGGGAFSGGDGGSGIVVIRYTPPPHYYSRLNGTWTQNNRWSLVDCNGASAGNAEPGPGDRVTICTGHTIQLNTSIGGAGLLDMTIQAGGELQMANNNTARSLTVAGDIINDGTLIMPTNRNTTSSLDIGGNLTNNGVFDMFTDADSLVDVTFNGSTAQTITGSSADSNFHNLILNNANGLTLTGTHNAIVNTTLTLTSGLLTTNDNIVHVVSGNAVAGAGATTFVAGNLRKGFATGTNVDRVYEVGTVTGGVLYAPVIIRLGNVTGAGDLTVSTTAGDHPNIGSSTLDPNLSINRYWTLADNTVTFTADAATGAWFIFNDPQDHDAGTDFNEFYVGRYDGANWTEITPTVRAANGTIIAGAEFTMTAFPGDYQIAHRVPTSPTCSTSLAGGIPGDYFNNMTLSGSPAGTRIDGPVDFDWGTGDPGVTGIGADQFSVRWDGILRATVTGNYQFQTVSDDGVRLWVNNTLIIDNWTDHAAATDTSGNVALTAGELYFIRLEYYENGGSAEIRLRWQPPGDVTFTPIPSGPIPALGAGLYYCPPQIPGLLAHYPMDEDAWTGAADEVEDISGNTRHGTATGGVTTAGTTPAIPGSPGTCRYGVFDGVDDYVQVANLSNILNGTASLAFWIRTSQIGNDTGWMAPGITGVELSGGADDIFWGWIDATGRIGISVANDYTTKSTASINTNTWRHVVLTRDHTAGTFSIFIDGALNNSGAITTGLIGTPFSSIGRIEDTGGTPEYFNGQLDEVRIYDFVLDATQAATVMNETRPCGSVIDHIRIQHDGVGLTCAPEQVTVRACLDASCSTEYTGSVTTTLSPTGWVGGDMINFSGGSTTSELRRTTPGVVTLGAGSTTPTTANNTRCFNGVTETCALEFFESGFIFDVPTQTACRPSADITITAVRTSDNGQTCAPAFSGARSVGFWSTYVDPNNINAPINVNGVDVVAASPGTGINLNFDANAQTTINVTYPDAGLMQLNARFEGSGAEAGLVMTGSDQFVSVPVGLAVYTDAPDCDASDANGPICGIAGEDFPLTVRAACWESDGDTDLSDNLPTQNFRMTSIPMTHAPIIVSNPGILGTTSFDFTASDNGIVTFNQTVSEVGIFTFTATPAANAYFGQTIPAASSPNIGRFIPARFNLSGGILTNRVNEGCAPLSNFTYMDETLQLLFTLTAQNSSGATTLNYAGSFAKLNPATTASLNIGAVDAGPPITPLSGRVDALNASGAWATGVTNITANVTLTRDASPDGPYENLQFGIAPLDGDLVTLGNFDLDVTGGGASHGQVGAATDVRFGRLVLENNSGSELLPLTAPLRAEFWNNTQFVLNAADSCTAYDSNDLGFSNRQGLNSVDPALAGNDQLQDGVHDTAMTLTLTAGNQLPGNIDATLPVDVWLQFDWDNDGSHDNDPAGHYTFGIFSGSDQQIYIREIY
jgi:MSHA biogenesis protein MshQ